MEILFGIALGVALTLISKKVYAMMKKKPHVSATIKPEFDTEGEDTRKPL